MNRSACWFGTNIVGSSFTDREGDASIVPGSVLKLIGFLGMRSGTVPLYGVLGGREKTGLVSTVSVLKASVNDRIDGSFSVRRFGCSLPEPDVRSISIRS